MINVVLIMGPSGSGKSFLQRKIVEQGYSEVISSTTREEREGEVNGVDYHFKKNREDFFKDDYIEHAQVGDNYYGTPVKEFYKSEKIAHVVEPYGAKQILDKFKNDKNVLVKVIFMDISNETCKKNLMGRKCYLSEKDESRLNRDIKDNISARVKETGILPDVTIKELDYNIKDIIGKL